MDKTLAGLLGTVGALAASLPAVAGPVAARPALQASSYADLFTPIPNAVEVLHAVDDQPAAEAPGLLETVQYHHHHHHHHRFVRRYHHHHHHHHHRYYRRGVFLIPR